MKPNRTLPWDWYPGVIPDNVEIEEGTYIESTISFENYRSQADCGLNLGKGSAIYKDTMLDLGCKSSMVVGDYTLIHGAHISCDGYLQIGSYVLISWQVVLMDNYRFPFHPSSRRLLMQQKNWFEHSHVQTPVKPICLNDNVWIGFEACILPGVTIGEGSIVGARSVVFESVPAYSIVAGNPAKLIRTLNKEERIL